LNPQSTQPALRGFIEEFSNNCRFILTCNFKNRIIEPLHSRCGVYEFNTSKKDMVKLAEQFFVRAKHILDTEKVEYDEKLLPPIIIKHAPDWRRILNELQRFSVLGLAGSSTAQVSNGTFDDLFVFLKEKDFKKMRSWVVNNIDTDASAIFRGIYDRMYDKLNPQSIPQLVLILADYQYKNAFVADHELNVVACLTEIMANVEFA
jgi:DNA polymerase III delta prime subunit